MERKEKRSCKGSRGSIQHARTRVTGSQSYTGQRPRCFEATFYSKKADTQSEVGSLMTYGRS